jgi:monoterpene epsilon-lactone hydrolase
MAVAERSVRRGARPTSIDSGSGIDDLLPPTWAVALAFLLAAIAGYIDVVSFVRVAGVFPANHSGNLVLIGIAIGNGDPTRATRSVVAVVAFILGATIVGISTQRAPSRLRPVVLLTLEAALLVVAACLSFDLADRPLETGAAGSAALVAMSVAMGVQTAVLRHVAGVSISTTYLSSAVFQLGSAFAAVTPSARARRASAIAFRTAVIAIIPLVVGYVGGAAVGVKAADHGPSGLVLVALILLALAAAPLLLFRSVTEPERDTTTAGPDEVDPRVVPVLDTIRSFGLALPTIEQTRAAFEDVASAIPPPEGVAVERTTVAGRDAIRVRPEGSGPSGRILYLHGGGYVIGSTPAQTGVPGRLALATGAEVVSVDYRLAPEHPCPAATEDAVAAYSALLEEGAVQAIVGDSAGGALAVLTAVAVRDAGLQPPGALVAFSPWTDLTGSSQRFRDTSFHDAVLPRAFLMAASQAWLGDRDPDDPAATPLHADLSGLPPTAIHVGGDELLLEDSVRLADVLGQAGVQVDLRVWPRMIHSFVAYPNLAPESDEALAESARFIRSASS